MGLDTTHGCWHGAYSAFSRWRNTIAEAAGYAVWNVKYDDGLTSPTIMLDWGHITAADLAGQWEKTPEDPLVVLLAHSDCDGVIRSADAGALADRLEEILPQLPSENDHGHIGNWEAKTRAFIDGLRKAALAGEDVAFG